MTGREKRPEVRILLVEDHTSFRELLRKELNRIPGFRVLGEAADGIEAVDKSLQLDPDIILMDLGLPDQDGLAASKQILGKTEGRARIIVLTAHVEAHITEQVMHAGAAGFLDKWCGVRELVRGIRQVMAGGRCLTVSRVPPERLPSESDSASVLSPRERQILELSRSGHTAAEIADQLSIAVSTVYTHRQRMMEKLDLNDSSSLVKYAIRTGLSPDE